MVALTPTDSAKLTGLVTDRVANTDIRAYKVVVVEDSTGGLNYTYDLTNINASVTGIVGVLGESIAGVKPSTAATWSSTTITAKGAGAYIGAFLCY